MWNFRGCYQDGPKQRVIAGPKVTDKKGMTLDQCAIFCGSKNLKFMGLSVGATCFW